MPTSARNSRIRATAVCTSRFSRTARFTRPSEGAVLEDREPGQIGRVGLKRSRRGRRGGIGRRQRVVERPDRVRSRRRVPPSLRPAPPPAHGTRDRWSSHRRSAPEAPPTSAVVTLPPRPAPAPPRPHCRPQRSPSPRITAKKSGMKKMPTVVAVSMPANTPVPSECRLGRAGAAGDHQRRDAEDERERGHQDRPEPLAGRLDRGLAHAASLGPGARWRTPRSGSRSWPRARPP